MKDFVGVIMHKDGGVYLQRRDSKPGLSYSGRLAVFGGSVEDGESNIEAAVRELAEETSLGATADDLVLFGEYDLPADEPEGIPPRHYVVFSHELQVDDFEVYEGVGYEIFSFDQIRVMIESKELGQGASQTLTEFIQKRSE